MVNNPNDDPGILDAWDDVASQNRANGGEWQPGDELFNQLYGPSGKMTRSEAEELLHFMALPLAVRKSIITKPSYGEGDPQNVPSQGGAKGAIYPNDGSGIVGVPPVAPLQEDLDQKIIPPNMMFYRPEMALLNPIGFKGTPPGAPLVSPGDNALMNFRRELDSGATTTGVFDPSKYGPGVGSGGSSPTLGGVGSSGLGPGTSGGGGGRTDTGISSGGFYDSLSRIESGHRDIYSGVDKDYPGQPNSRSQGFFQIDTPTWRQFAGKAGVDVSKYPQAKGTDYSIQQQVVANIPLARFGPRTQKMLQQEYGGSLDPRMTIGQLAAKFEGVGGGGGGGASASAISTPSAPSDSSAALAETEMKLNLLREMFPQHQITPVPYNPFVGIPAAPRRIDVNQGVG